LSGILKSWALVISKSLLIFPYLEFKVTYVFQNAKRFLQILANNPQEFVKHFTMLETLLKFLWVFIIGGGICMLGQLLILRTDVTPSRILTFFVCVGVLLGALQLFEPIKKFASSGITVPIVGFGGVLSEGVIKAVKEYGFIGIFTGGVAAAAAGLAVAVTAALLVSLVARSRQKM